MSKHEFDNWDKEVLEPLRSMERAKPNPELFNRIAERFETQKPVPASQISWAAAAAVLLLFSNIYFLSNYVRSNKTSSEFTNTETTLTTDFNFYE